MFLSSPQTHGYIMGVHSGSNSGKCLVWFEICTKRHEKRRGIVGVDVVCSKMDYTRFLNASFSSSVYVTIAEFNLKRINNECRSTWPSSPSKNDWMPFVETMSVLPAASPRYLASGLNILSDFHENFYRKLTISSEFHENQHTDLSTLLKSLN